MSIDVVQISPEEPELFNDVVDLFGDAFGDRDTYTSRRPGPEYVATLLSSDYFIALAARIDGETVGGIAAYELRKFEQQRSEIYIYDLAVAKEFRRKGVASAMIITLKAIARTRGAYLIYVQADTDDEDGPARALYSTFGTGTDVRLFEIGVE